MQIKNNSIRMAKMVLESGESLPLGGCIYWGTQRRFYYSGTSLFPRVGAGQTDTFENSTSSTFILALI